MTPDDPTGRASRSPTSQALGRRHFLTVTGAAALGGRLTRALEPTWLAASPVDPTRDSATRLAAAIRRREISATELLEACLRRIEAVNPKLNAVVQMDIEGARALAKRVDQQRGISGPLHGVPITIKDSFDTAGIISTGGTLGRKNFIPTEDATIVARLRKAGAIVLGKTNTPELTAGAETNNRVYGRTNNPYDPTRTPGGSSGGSAAILAAGGSPFDIGTDTSGSIRLPSHFCGIAGLKPTGGRLSRMGHIVEPEGILQGITQPGPMARRVEDLALGLGIMAGPDWRDPYVVPMPVGDPAKVVLRGLKVAVFTDNGVITPRADLMEAVRRSAAVLRSAGTVVSEARPDGLKLATDSAFTLMTADGGATLIRVLDRVGTGPGDSDLRTAVAAVTPMSSGDFTALLERLDQARMTMLRFLERFDAIVCPVNADVAVKHGTAAERIYPGLSYTVPFNVAGWPAGVVRAATSSEGLPIGVQVVAGPWREDIVLALLAQLERELGGWQPVPGL